MNAAARMATQFIRVAHEWGVHSDHCRQQLYAPELWPEVMEFLGRGDHFSAGSNPALSYDDSI